MSLPLSRRRARTTRPGRAVVCVSSIVLAATLLAPAAEGSPARRSHVRVIAPGIALTTLVDRRIPLRAYVLWIDPAQGGSIGVALASGHLGALERTSDMAKDAGAIAAVNGDFGSLSHRPSHPFVQGGDLVQTSLVNGAMFSVSSDGSMRIGVPTQSVSVTEADSGETEPIATWNHGAPAPGEIAAYTAAGGTVEAPRPYTCSARLLPSGPPTATSDGSERAYTVDQAGCFSGRMAPGDGVVLSAVPATDEATTIRSLSVGESMTIDWSLGWPAIEDAIGGSNVLVSGGRVVLGPCSGAICARNPRTGIGLTADGRIVLVVVDGRQFGAAGMTLPEFATFMAGLGVESAMNLDGGGSSTMVLKGGVANSPSDGFERSVTNAIVVRFSR